MLIRVLPLVAGVVPIIGVSITYWLAVNSGVLPSCTPYLDGCVSISATGRYMPASLLFHAVMLPQSVVLLFMWYFAAQWLRNIAPGSRAPDTVVAAGVVGAAALILYVTFLGTHGSFYEFMRRFGIYFYFLGTAVAQLTLGIALLGHARRSGAAQLKQIAVGMLWLGSSPFVLGVLNLVLKSVLDDPDAAENRIEWISALLMQGYFVLIYVAWRITNFTVTVETN